MAIVTIVNPNTGEQKQLTDPSQVGLSSFLQSGWVVPGTGGYGYDTQSQSFSQTNPQVTQLVNSLKSSDPAAAPAPVYAPQVQQPMVTMADTTEGTTATGTPQSQLKVRIALINPETGVVDTGLADGSSPMQFPNWEAARQYILNNGETVQRVDSAEQAFQIVRQYTGNPTYSGYGDNYQAPTPQPGSPAALGQPYDPTWSQVPPNAPPGTPTGPLTPGGPLPAPIPTIGGTPTGGGGAGLFEPGGAYRPGAPASTANLTGDLDYMLRQLIQESRDQGRAGQDNLTNVFDDLKNYLAFTRSAAEQSYNRGNELATSLTDMVTPGIQSAIGTMNQATGLSPQAMQVLQQQAVEGTERDYQGQVQALKTQLAQRGAFGGKTPGDVNAILGGYAPLMGQRDANRSNLLAQTTLADEQRKFDTLGLNRQTAASFAGLGGGLATSLKNAYSPAPFLGGNESALGNLLNATQMGTSSGFQGLDLASRLTGQRGLSSQDGGFGWGDLLSGGASVASLFL